VVGAGPAGLYLAARLRRQQPGWRLRVVEQNPPDATFGFGVVFSDRALEFLREDDPETHAAIAPAMEHWTDLAVVHRGERIVIDGIGFSAIGRLALLRLLRERLAAAGVTPEHRRPVERPGDLEGYDLVVGADGVNSVVRGWRAAAFGTTVTHRVNRFAWFGTPRPFDALTQTFVETPHGAFTAHHYRYAPDMSTFIVECGPATWERAGFAVLDEPATLRACERIFAGALEGHPLVSNRSVWRRFPRVANARWSDGHVVLLGDALHTAHFSIGSGTRLAMEDAIALARALGDHPRDLREALAAFEARRRPLVETLVTAADASAAWYEALDAHVGRAPWDLAWSYVQRSGRLDPERLRAVAPRFVSAWEARQPQAMA
jgi:2-polyprenyl-6-methoxyphenol hydroxylase-like FAD-dependent oxidoreductase